MLSFGYEFLDKDIIVVEEKFNFNEILIFKGHNNNWYPQDMDATTHLIRNLIDDSYNLELGIYNHASVHAGHDRPYVAINNKYLFSSNHNNPLFSFLPNEYKKGFHYKVHRSFFDNLALQNTFTIAFGVDYQNISPYLHYILTPEFGIKQKYVNFGFNQILLIKSLKKVILSLPDDLRKKNLFNQSIHKLVPNIKFVFNEMYIVPEQIDQMNGNHTLFKIYMRNGDESSHKYDYKFKEGILKTSALSSKLTTSFYPNYNKKIRRNFGVGFAELLGEIAINESTFYDYKNKITVEGFGNNSIIGEVVPYNFRGEFKHNLKMHFNSSFGELNLRLFGNIAQPLLDVDEGMYKLLIKEMNNHLNSKWKINAKGIALLRSRLSAKNPIITSLKGLESLHEYD